MTVEAFLRESAAALGVAPRLVWVDEATLKARQIDGMVPWILAGGNDLGHTSIRTTRSQAAGLSHRPVSETVRDTLSWFKALPDDRPASATWVITRDVEREILAATRAR